MCHGCNARWGRSEEEVTTCPQCGSEFIELVQSQVVNVQGGQDGAIFAALEGGVSPAELLLNLAMMHQEQEDHVEDQALQDAVSSSLEEESNRKKQPCATAVRKEIAWSQLVEDEECPICCSDMEANALQRTLGCGHSYHDNCLMMWLDEQNFCPVCRHPVGEPFSSHRPSPPSASSTSGATAMVATSECGSTTGATAGATAAEEARAIAQQARATARHAASKAKKTGKKKRASLIEEASPKPQSQRTAVARAGRNVAVAPRKQN